MVVPVAKRDETGAGLSQARERAAPGRIEVFSSAEMIWSLGPRRLPCQNPAKRSSMTRTFSMNLVGVAGVHPVHVAPGLEMVAGQDALHRAQAPGEVTAAGQVALPPELAGDGDQQRSHPIREGRAAIRPRRILEREPWVAQRRRQLRTQAMTRQVSMPKSAEWVTTDRQSVGLYVKRPFAASG